MAAKVSKIHTQVFKAINMYVETQDIASDNIKGKKPP